MVEKISEQLECCYKTLLESFKTFFIEQILETFRTDGCDSSSRKKIKINEHSCGPFSVFFASNILSGDH